jgi:NADH-quinone oxidoreductase subunit J
LLRPWAKPQAGVQYSNTKDLGKLLYTQYLYPVEIAAVILLVAMIAAIALTCASARTARRSLTLRSRSGFGSRPSGSGEDGADAARIRTLPEAAREEKKA